MQPQSVSRVTRRILKKKSTKLTPAVAPLTYNIEKDTDNSD